MHDSLGCLSLTAITSLLTCCAHSSQLAFCAASLLHTKCARTTGDALCLHAPWECAQASPRQLRVLRAAAAKHGAASVPPLEEQKAWQRWVTIVFGGGYKPVAPKGMHTVAAWPFHDRAASESSLTPSLLQAPFHGSGAGLPDVYAIRLVLPWCLARSLAHPVACCFQGGRP
eukprot:scaffold292369_cov23-Tisochrysis_lutea.AAC.1